VSFSPSCRCVSCPVHDAAPARCPVYPSSSITDAQWAVLEPLLPPPGNTRGKGGRSEKHPRRLVLGEIFYLVRGGIAWAQLPREFPPHQTVYGAYRRWARDGSWQQIHDALRDLVRLYEGRDPLPSAAIIDAQTVRGADTVPTASAGYDAGKKTVASDTSPWTLSGSCSPSSSPAPTSKTATAPTVCWWRCAPASALFPTSGPTGATQDAW
jgi:transposase